jgi:hypothetical protein
MVYLLKMADLSMAMFNNQMVVAISLKSRGVTKNLCFSGNFGENPRRNDKNDSQFSGKPQYIQMS